MATCLYDNALINKLRSWTEGTSATIVGPDQYRQFLEVTADIQDDRPLTLPIICLRRDNSFVMRAFGKTPLTHDALKMAGNPDRLTQMMAIPVELKYTLIVYTRYYREADEYLRNFIFNFINYPKMEIEVPYESISRMHVANIVLGEDVQIDPASAEGITPGQLTKGTLSFTIPDAYLFDVRTRGTKEINPIYYSIAGDNDTLERQDLSEQKIK